VPQCQSARVSATYLAVPSSGGMAFAKSGRRCGYRRPLRAAALTCTTVRTPFCPISCRALWLLLSQFTMSFTVPCRTV